MSAFSKLVELFRKFPGIGPRQAKRFVFFLLSKDKSFLDELASTITELHAEMARCTSCFRYFAKRSGSRCDLCADRNRDESVLLLVAKDTDLEAFEKGDTYRGRYFVLGGTIPILEKHPEILRLTEFTKTVEERAKGGVLKEIILALNANPDGEHTADELRKLLSPIVKRYSLRMTTLGRGLSTGSELEYADPQTLISALKNRGL